jgi:hypothetical protein
MANLDCQLRFTVIEKKIGLRVEGLLDIDKGEIISKGDYFRTLTNDEHFLWKQFVECIFGSDNFKGIHNDEYHFSFEIEKIRGAKVNKNMEFSRNITDWLENESTNILLHRLSCPINDVSSFSQNRKSAPSRLSETLSLSCGATMKQSPTTTLKSHLNSFKFGTH